MPLRRELKKGTAIEYVLAFVPTRADRQRVVRGVVVGQGEVLLSSASAAMSVVGLDRLLQVEVKTRLPGAHFRLFIASAVVATARWTAGGARLKPGREFKAVHPRHQQVDETDLG